MRKSGDYFVFPGGGTQFKEGVSRYVGFVEKVFIIHRLFSLNVCLSISVYVVYQNF